MSQPYLRYAERLSVTRQIDTTSTSSMSVMMFLASRKLSGSSTLSRTPASSFVTMASEKTKISPKRNAPEAGASAAVASPSAQDGDPVRAATGRLATKAYAPALTSGARTQSALPTEGRISSTSERIRSISREIATMKRGVRDPSGPPTLLSFADHAQARTTRLMAYTSRQPTRSPNPSKGTATSQSCPIAAGRKRLKVASAPSTSARRGPSIPWEIRPSATTTQATAKPTMNVATTHASKDEPQSWEKPWTSN